MDDNSQKAQIHEFFRSFPEDDFQVPVGGTLDRWYVTNFENLSNRQKKLFLSLKPLASKSTSIKHRYYLTQKVQ